MATILSQHLPHVVAMMQAAPEPPRWWTARIITEMPAARRDAELLRVVRDVARARGMRPAEIRQQLIDAGGAFESLPKAQIKDPTDPAIVADISARMDEAMQSYRSAVERAAEAQWRAMWAVDMVSAAVDAVAAAEAKGLVAPAKVVV